MLATHVLKATGSYEQASYAMRRNWVFLIVRLNGGSASGIECLHVPVGIELERLREA